VESGASTFIAPGNPDFWESSFDPPLLAIEIDLTVEKWSQNNEFT